MSRSRRSILTAAWIGISLTASGVMGQNSVAQEQKPAAAPESEQKSAAPPGDLLRGPKVEDEPGERDPSFGAPERDRAPQRDASLDQRLWLRALESLDLTDDQRAKKDEILKELRSAVRAYMQENREAMNELRQKRVAARESGKPDPENDKQLRELLAKTPNLAQYRDRILAVLTPEQQATLRERLVEPNQLDQMAQRRVRFLRARQLKTDRRETDMAPKSTDRQPPNAKPENDSQPQPQ